jgi:hypothetical protein
MLHYLYDYGSFLLGAALYILAKMQKYKEMAEANPNPNVKSSWKAMFNKEVINFIRLLLGGVALVIFLPMLIGGATVDFKSVEGQVITTLTLQSLLIPMYFFVGYAGNSALFAFFGKYEKTLLNRVGVDDTTPTQKTP